MSDEFEFPDEDEGENNDDQGDDGDDGDEIGDELGDDGEQEAEGEDQSPLSIYNNAKDNIGLADDSETIDQFMHVFETADDKNLKTKAIGHALSIMAQGDDIERLVSTLSTYIEMANKSEVTQKRFVKRIDDILGRCLHSEDIYTAALNKCAASVDRGVFNFLFYDLKFKQLDLQLNAGLQPEAEKIAKELEENIPLTPDQDDPTMAKYTRRLLITNIDLALARGDEATAIEYYSKISNMPESDVPSLRVSGVIKETKGLQFLHEDDYQSSKNLLREAFTDFNNGDSDKRTAVLPYYTIAFMLCRERGLDPYRAQELMALQSHPRVAPMRQLFDAYINNDVVKFDEKLESAKSSFNNDFYTSKLMEIRHDVLMHSIATFTKPYSIVKISYIANQLKSDEDEVRKCIFDLIYADQYITDDSMKFGRLVDDIDDTVIKRSQPQLDDVVSPFMRLLDVVDEMAKNYLSKLK